MSGDTPHDGDIYPGRHTRATTAELDAWLMGTLGLELNMLAHVALEISGTMPAEIGDEMRELVAGGFIERDGESDGEPTYKLTDRGLLRCIELLTSAHRILTA